MDTTRRVASPQQVLRNLRNRYAVLVVRKVNHAATEEDLKEMREIQMKIMEIQRVLNVSPSAYMAWR